MTEDLTLDSDVRFIKGVGEKKAQALSRLGIKKLRDLITYYPRDYEDRTTVKSIRDTCDGETVCVSCIVSAPVRTSRVRRGLTISKCRATDGRDMIDITFFNQNWRAETLKPGQEYLFYGRVTKNLLKTELTNPEFDLCGENMTDGGIVPVYRLTSGVTRKMISGAAGQALKLAEGNIPEILPEDIMRRNDLCPAEEAYRNIHFPTDMMSLDKAKKRLVFEEFFVLSLGLVKLKNRRQNTSGLVMDTECIKNLQSSLPYSLTGAQKRAVEIICHDLKSGMVMNRLVQGDVGSGKTVVAACAAFAAAENGYQTALMVPTEILAQQHYDFFQPLFEKFGIETVLLTGGMKTSERRAAVGRISSGEAKMIIGTHALFSEDVAYSSLGLVITDEQHRFGVNQRASLASKGDNTHLLVMSATPIPRTMALIIYGDLDITVIDELPPGRQKVDTYAVKEDKRQRLNSFIRKQKDEGHQTFVVCPAIEENEDTGIKSVEEHYRELSEALPDLKISVLHGKMKSSEKDRIMEEFAQGQADVLLSTTVIEVGVDVPNATLMIIEDADRFGLSQLHQLRGRVGRGRAKSYCVLVSDSTSDNARDRLKTMCETNDGFRIAEKDLEIRGPGDFFGSRQHGLPDMKIASISGDTRILAAAQQEAELFLNGNDDISNKYPALRERVKQLFEANGDIFN